MTKDIIYEAVAELWHVGMGTNKLFHKVEERLNSDGTSTIKEESSSTVKVTKQEVKAAKLMLPYTYKLNKHDEGGEKLSEERIKFVNDKIHERQNHRRSRRFKDADYIQRGLDKMGIVLNDATKSWFYQSPNQKGNDNDDVDKEEILKSKDENQSLLQCEMCGKFFKSRNNVFKHLRDPGSGCGNSIFVTGQSMPIAPSIQKKVEKKMKVAAAKTAVSRTRARTGRTAQHADSSSSVWIGDLPLPWTRLGGKYKRLRALLREYLPRDIPQPWVKIVVRKAYRKRSDDNENINNSTNKKQQKDEYLGFAIVVFRCDEEAEKIRKTMDGLEVCPTKVFQSDEIKNDQLLQIPKFCLKIRAVENGDSSMTSQEKKGGKDPPLSEQLRPFTIDELKKRILDLKINHYHENMINLNKKKVEGTLNDNESECDAEPMKVGKPLNQSQQHEQMIEEATALYRSIGARKELKSEGRTVPEEITKPLLEILQSLRWQVPNERGHLNAERYLVLPTNVSNDRFYGDLREACKKLMQWADESYFYSGIAVVRLSLLCFDCCVLSMLFF